MKTYIYLLLVILFLTSCSNKQLSKADLKLQEAISSEKQNNIQLAISQYQEASMLGQKIASLYLARLNRYKTEDYKEMLFWYGMAHNRGNETAALELAYYYETINKYDKAIAWYKKVEKFSNRYSRNTIANYQLGYLYYKLKDYDNANFWFNKVSNGWIDIRSIQFIAQVLPNLKSTEKTYQWHEKPKSYEKDISAIQYVSDSHQLKNYKNMNLLIEKVSKKRDKDSAYELARIYFYLYRDVNKAITFYQKAYALGHKDAAYELAQMIYENTLEDYTNTKVWYKKAHEQGHKNAAFYLALMYDFKFKDYKRALIWYKKAHSLEHKGASSNMLLIYEKYILNNKEVIKWSKITGSKI